MPGLKVLIVCWFTVRDAWSEGSSSQVLCGYGGEASVGGQDSRLHPHHASLRGKRGVWSTLMGVVNIDGCGLQ